MEHTNIFCVQNAIFQYVKSSSMALQPLWAWADVFISLIYTQSVGLLGRVISPLQGRYLHTGQPKRNRPTQTSMPRLGLEHTISEFERVKRGHALDRAATVIGRMLNRAVHMVTTGL
jgi:hypothetical protein